MGSKLKHTKVGVLTKYRITGLTFQVKKALHQRVKLKRKMKRFVLTKDLCPKR